MNADILAIMKMPKRAPAPTPTYQQICDFAADLAQECYDGKELAKLVYYPLHASPPPEPFCFFMGWAARLRERARIILTERMAELPRPKIRYKRCIPKRPIRTWTWTQRPLKHTHPPPRRRLYRPPGLEPIPPDPRDLSGSPAYPRRYRLEPPVFGTLAL